MMTFQDTEELTEEEKSEWAMDIAYDMDEFFRQHDPQYAAEHPEEHAAKEEIYENLMVGRISALDEKLAALGQTQEDYRNKGVQRLLRLSEMPGVRRQSDFPLQPGQPRHQVL